MNTVVNEESEYNRRMIVKGVKINYPVRDQENMIMVIEKATGLPVFLDRKQDFDGKIHMRVPVAAPEVEAPVVEKIAPVKVEAPLDATDTPENKFFWDELVAKKNALTFAKLSGDEKALWKKLKPLYGETK